jgi:hypothetical protein
VLNCLKRAETDIVLSVLDVRAYIVIFSASLDMNRVPEILYLGQNHKEYVMKEAVRLKRLERCLFLPFLDNLPVVLFNYKTLQNKHNIRTLSGK